MSSAEMTAILTMDRPIIRSIMSLVTLRLFFLTKEEGASSRWTWIRSAPLGQGQLTAHLAGAQAAGQGNWEFPFIKHLWDLSWSTASGFVSPSKLAGKLEHIMYLETGKAESGSSQRLAKGLRSIVTRHSNDNYNQIYWKIIFTVRGCQPLAHTLKVFKACQN